MQAMTDVSEMARELMNSFEDAMAIMGCADTGSAADDKASAYIEPERQLAQEALAAWAQARPRAPGSRPALYHVHANTAGLHAPAAID
jgi:hypothetical protein